MGALSPMHWLIIVGVVVLLFGAKRLPDAARSLGRSARILQAEVGQMHDTRSEAHRSPAGVPSAPISDEQASAATPAARTDQGHTGPSAAGGLV